ncbi:MAG: hypothetical protein AAF384_20230, partial [Pseudomonadota bacterium]
MNSKTAFLWVFIGLLAGVNLVGDAFAVFFVVVVEQVRIFLRPMMAKFGWPTTVKKCLWIFCKGG